MMELIVLRTVIKLHISEQLKCSLTRLCTPQPVMCLREAAAARHPRHLSPCSAGPGTPDSLAGHPQCLSTRSAGPGTPDSLAGHPQYLSTRSAGPGERTRPAYPAPCMFSTWLRLDSITEVKASSSSMRNPLHTLQIFLRATSAYSRMLKLWLKHHCSTIIRACFRIRFWKERIILHM